MNRPFALMCGAILAVLGLAALGTTPALANTVAVTYISGGTDNTVGGGRDANGSYRSYGYRFTVSRPLNVTKLGVFDLSYGSGTLNGSPIVNLYDHDTLTLLATGAPGGVESDECFWVTLDSPVLISHGTNYDLTVSGSGTSSCTTNEHVFRSCTVAWDSSVSWVGGGTRIDATGNVDHYLTGVSTSYECAYIGPNFQFTSAPSTMTAAAETRDWNVPAAWIGGVVPASGDTAALSYALSNITVTASTSAAALQVTAGTLTVNSNQTLTISGDTSVSGGTVNLSGQLATETLTLSGGSITGTGTLTGVSYDVRKGTISASLAGSGVSLTKTTADTAILSGTNSYTGSTTVSEGTLNVSGSIALSSSVSVLAGAMLSGSGVVPGISGAGIVSPGDSPGILEASQVDPSGGMDFAFEFTQTTPIYNSPTASGNDVLHITGSTPFTEAMTPGNEVNVYFNLGHFALGDYGTGGWYTNVGGTDFLSHIGSATYHYYVYDDNNGPVYFGEVWYNTLASYNTNHGSNFSVNVSTIAQSASFGGGNIDGRVTKFTVTISGSSIPEPAALGLLGLALLGLRRGRRP